MSRNAPGSTTEKIATFFGSNEVIALLNDFLLNLILREFVSFPQIRYVGAEVVFLDVGVAEHEHTEEVKSHPKLEVQVIGAKLSLLPQSRA